MKINLNSFPTYIPEDRCDDLSEVMSFSGGRSSAFALMSLINGGFGNRAQKDYVLFENMGKEDESCYLFLKQIEDETGIKINWLEFTLTPKFSEELLVEGFSYDKFDNCEYTSISQILNLKKLTSLDYRKSSNNFWYTEGYSNREESIKEVDFYSASRNGKPYADLFIYKCAIRIMKGEGLIMPTASSRWCTGDGKEKVGDRWLANKGIREFISYKGMRFDEPDRVAKVKAKNDKQNMIWYECPMHHTKTIKIDVLLAWGNQNIDLGLSNGVNTFKDVIGNCDHCHLKKKIKKLWLMQNGWNSLFFQQIELLANNYNGDIDCMARGHGSYASLQKQAEEMPLIELSEVLSNEEVEISCFGCGD